MIYISDSILKMYQWKGVNIYDRWYYIVEGAVLKEKVVLKVDSVEVFYEGVRQYDCAEWYYMRA